MKYLLAIMRKYLKTFHRVDLITLKALFQHRGLALKHVKYCFSHHLKIVG